MSIYAIFLSAFLVNNMILSRFLGICSFLGVSSRVSTAVGMGTAVSFVMLLSSVMTWLVYHLLLEPLGITYLSTLTFILVIASLVQFVEMVMRKFQPALHRALGIYLPLITTNCAILGVAVINVSEGYSLLESIVYSLGASLGFFLAMILMASLRERMDQNDGIPEAMKGLPIALVTAALMSIAFMGFSGLI